MTDDLHAFESEPRSRSKADAAGRRRRTWPAFLIGLALGVVAALVLPPLLSPYVPEALRQGGEDVVGVVADKQREEQRLLLTVRAQQGAILATFNRRLAEIDLLVSPGDTVTLGVGEYEPFVENPILRGVRKAEPRPAEPPERRRASDLSPPASDTIPEADEDRPESDTVPPPVDPEPSG